MDEFELEEKDIFGRTLCLLLKKFLPKENVLFNLSTPHEGSASSWNTNAKYIRSNE